MRRVLNFVDTIPTGARSVKAARLRARQRCSPETRIADPRAVREPGRGEDRDRRGDARATPARRAHARIDPAPRLGEGGPRKRAAARPPP